MIHYSKSILNNIIDSSSDEELLKNVKQFEDDINMIFTYFAYSNISLDYVETLLNFKTNKYAFWSNNEVFNIRDCTSCMIYANNTEKAYIMLICTHNNFKNKGFGTKLIKQFANDMRSKGIKSILLSSVEEYVSYYQKLGFEAIDDNLEEYPYLKKFEKVSNDKITTIMELQL
jgi:N-acetylglutamate synthase-like GNAT family acetyltransferase